MPYQVLGQQAPAADTDTTLYTVPASTEVVVSTIVVANRSGSLANFRIAVRPNGAAISNEHYIYYDVALSGNSTFAATVGLTMDATDVVTVRSNTADLSFSMYGRTVPA